MRTGLKGVAAEMRKPKKTAQTRKKTLDAPGKKGRNVGRRGQNRPFPPSVSETDEHYELTGLPSWTVDLATPEKQKKGRPTISDNLLLGNRNSWLHFLEEAWPEIGWPLLSIRKVGSGTIEDIQRIFEPVQSKDNCDHGKAFVRGLPQTVEREELRRHRIRHVDLCFEIQNVRGRCVEALRSCVEGEEALKHTGEQERKIIQAEIQTRWEQLFQLLYSLIEAEKESEVLAHTVVREETYWYCSQLLDFLEERRCAVVPIKVANALAGLPDMGWRESHERCYKMPRSFPERLPYRVLKAVSRIWRRRPRDLDVVPTEFFRIQICKLPRKSDSIRETFCRAWRSLRLAIVECWGQHNQDFMPYAITLAFLRHHCRSKSVEEQILDQVEALSCT